MRETPRKTLVLGSGAIKISEAAEFDYSGTQALKALREEGVETVLVNPNIATIQTSYKFADHIYLGPLETWFAEKVIERETPDSILLGFGGQTALSLGVDLYRKGVLDKYGVRVLGTSIEGIERALSRSLFRESMVRHGIPIPPSSPAENPGEALRLGEEIGFPIIVRVSFNLGGGGSFVAWSRGEMEKLVHRAFAQSATREVLVEKYLHYWKEIEFEVVRDSLGNNIAVACLENMDPMGVHTGESVVVAPCQTLSDREYQVLRTASQRVAEAIGLVGEGNVQLALNPWGSEFYVIETNPRMSRSSSLASKATGYPLAYIAAKLALGYRVHELMNKVTGRTCSCFEPSLDYVVVKIPRWDLDKFHGVEESVTSEMKSIGEVMAVGRNLGEALQKAIRMLDIGREGLVDSETFSNERQLDQLINDLKARKPYWPLLAAEAFVKGATVREVYHATGVDPYFLVEIKKIADLAVMMRQERIIEEYLGLAKRLGFSDRQISMVAGLPVSEVEEKRRELNIGRSRVNQVDTLAAEWPAETGYLYMTHEAYDDDLINKEGNVLLIIGAGVFRIGVSVEFDWGVVAFSEEAKQLGYNSVIVNYNPETVSTDWDMGRRLYFEELTLERIRDIYEVEDPAGIIGFLGGQISNKLARRLEEQGLKLLGTSGYSVDKAENRALFSSMLEELGLKQPPWIEAATPREALDFAERVGYPVLVRPSYVLSGSAMSLAYNNSELETILEKASIVSPEYPVVVSKFMEDSSEVELDCAGDGVTAVCGLLEHIEPAGVHSGDSTMIISPSPPRVTKELARATSAVNEYLRVKGPYNLQFLVKNGEPYIIELNLRTSRSMPFTSKTTGYSLMKAASEASLKGRITTTPENAIQLDGTFILETNGYYGVKTPQFSWARLKGAYPTLGPEMKSTGEVAALGETLGEALLKSWLSAKPNEIPGKEKLVVVYHPDGRPCRKLEIAAATLGGIGYRIVSPMETWYPRNAEPMETRELIRLIKNGQVGLLLTTGGNPERDYNVRRAAADFNVSLVLDSTLAEKLSLTIAETGGVNGLEAVELSDYWKHEPVGVL